MTDKPFPITLLLVSYKKADVIGKVIESVSRGTVLPDLLVVSDDGSTDGTPEAAAGAAGKAGLPCRILRHLRAGPYRLQTMRNSGVANALEGMVFLSDSDCLFGEHTLETHLAIHREHPAAIGTGPRFEFMQGTGGPFTSMYCTLEFAHFPQANYLVPFGANLSFPKSLWRRLGGFDRIYEGSYGLDDHEFCLRAEKLGAVCVSDPGGHLFHCPHDTIFGGRKVLRNWNIFHGSFGLHIGAEEWWYVHHRVAPWYWSGRRKTPLLGDRVTLDRWGAPAGYEPPLHLRLSRSLEPLFAPVRDLLEGRTDLTTLRDFARAIHRPFLPQTSLAFRTLTDLLEILDTGGKRAFLTRWLNRGETLQSASNPTDRDQP